MIFKKKSHEEQIRELKAKAEIEKIKTEEYLAKKELKDKIKELKDKRVVESDAKPNKFFSGVKGYLDALSKKYEEEDNNRSKEVWIGETRIQ